MSASAHAKVHAQSSDYRNPPGSVYLSVSVIASLTATVGDCVRISTARGRVVLGRIAGTLAEDDDVIQFDRFARQSLKAFPHEEVLLESVDLGPARQVILTPAIPLSVGQVQQVTHAVKQTLVEQCVPVREGMLLYVKINETAGVTYEVHSVSGQEAIVTDETAVFLTFGSDHEHDHEHGSDHEHAHTGTRVLDTTYDDVGGLTEQIRAVRELVELPLVFPQVYAQLGITPPRGVIFYGAPGTGKTLLARSVANEIDASFTYVNGPEIVGTYSGQTEENLRKIFGEASLKPPAIIFIDEVDALAPIRGTAGTLSDLRAVTQLLSLMDGLKRSEGVVVIGTTNRIEALDPALRRAGRFDREIYFPTPSARAREEILRVHTRDMPLTDAALAHLPEVARRAHGFVGADLLELAREAALHALRHAAGAFLDSPSPTSYPDPADLVVTDRDFDAALRSVRPSSLRESLMVDPGVTWDDVGGLANVKHRLQELIELPLRQPDLFERVGLASHLGVVLYGPAGTGKTLLARAVAAHARVNFISVQGAELFSQWLGESEESVRRLFRTAQRAAPCIIFFDQLDAIARLRSASVADGNHASHRVLNQLLAELDGLEQRSQVLVIGATNALSLVDPAALRPGRFGVHLYVGLPDEAERAEILHIHLRERQVEDIPAVAAVTDGMSGADLALVCQTARLRALYRHRPLKLEDLLQAVREVTEAAGRDPDLTTRGRRPDTSPD